MMRSNHRALFALFIKILLQSIKESGDMFLYQQVRIVIATCTKRNRMGDPNFMPLEDVLEVHLRQMVGEAHWLRALEYRRAYVSLQEKRERRKLVKRQRDMALASQRLVHT